MASAVADRALPTLLESRRSSAESGLKASRSRPAPPALELSSLAVPEVHVKNTFIHVMPSPLLSTMNRQRALLTCPSALVGRLTDDGHFAEEPPPAPMCQNSTPFSATPFDVGGFDTLGAQAPPFYEAAKQVLSLASALDCPDTVELGAPDAGVALPSVGSAGHAVGTCQPCALVHAVRCNHGPACRFCHLCGPEERKRRKREKLEMRRAARAAESSQVCVSRQLCMPRSPPVSEAW
eukprot:CAMPEP_0176078404 /NCGR_PEP_ID=MMETSP0120_2-20121206/39208_1 /TAXON_ID=160619 /ORGANISM="Kryptoperidinium foliaceum, Strain CCMP 1326" /LENGTH=236 /DNA_ID=CAMNT_0017412149 /DNA_START=1 /DNA_END=711 /DNA_ORIENTATION=-